MTRAHAFATATVVAAAACAGGDTPAPTSEAALLDARVTLEVGEVDGPLERSFGRVSGVALDDAGRIYVADQQAHTVRVFDADGAYLFSIGREGEGPGDLASPCCPGIAGDVLWLRDNGNHRLSAYRLQGDSVAFLATRVMGHGSVDYWASTFFDGDVVYDVGEVYDREGEGMTTVFATGPDQAPRAVAAIPGLLPEEYGGGQTLDFRSGAITGRGYFDTPFGPRHLKAFGPSGRTAEAISSRYAVTLRSPAGDSALVAVPDVLGPALSDRERALGEERLAADAQRIRRLGGSVTMRVPDRKPPLEALWFDRDGRLWAERSVVDGAPREADVYDTYGALVGRRRWPAEVGFGPVGWIDGDVGLGVARDSLGVQRVVRLEWAER